MSNIHAVSSVRPPDPREITVDLFAGGGGASTGIEQGLGRHVDIAVNHDPQAISLHERNHPQTRHFCSDVFEVDPITVTDEQPVGLMWASPDCKHFSKAKGGKPVSKRVRGLAWVVVRWAKAVRPRVICLENVEEFKDWGPLDANNMPDAAKKGRTFKRWCSSLVNLGYKVEHRELRACRLRRADHPQAPVRRRALRRAADRVAGADARQGAQARATKPWRTAAECIDWSDLGRSIFEREKPLAEATLRRIAHGIRRYVIDNPAVHRAGHAHASSVVEPLRTVTRRGEPLRTVAHTTARGGRVRAQLRPHPDADPDRLRRARRARRRACPASTSRSAPASMAPSTRSSRPTLIKHYGGKPKDERTDLRQPDSPCRR
jgi:DNA (cytosine-5)-methyltransferase 1